jgi:hypothetical protein
MSKRNEKIFWLLYLILMILIWPFIPAEDPSGYFAFSDSREVFGIPCWWNVVSNLAILGVGLWGIINFLKNQSPHDRYYKLTIAVAAIWTACGSAYFHWNPLVSTVFWDRWPMTLAFSAVISWILSDKVSKKIGPWIFIILFFSSTVVLAQWLASDDSTLFAI